MTPTISDLATLIDATVHVPESVADAPTDLLAQAITSVSLDSSDTEQGGLFAALPGTKVHGAQFAARTNSAAVITDHAGWLILLEEGETRPVLEVPDVRKVLGTVSAEVYRNPSADMTVIGITGTSGKTTTSYLLEAGLMQAGLKVGLIGTTGTRIAGQPVPTSLTTPEAPTLQSLFRRMRDEGVSHVVMEVSSHALMLGRVQGVDFDVAGFTNLSQDHLDFHSSMAEYFEAKAMFFAAGSPIRADRAVICVDDEWGKKMFDVACAERDDSAVWTIATSPDSSCYDNADYRTDNIEVAANGIQTCSLTSINGAAELTVPLPGKFNVANATLAVALADAAGVADRAAVIAGIAQVGVPGRMQRIDRGQDFLAIVDYAHKPAAIAAVLDTVRTQASGRIAIVVGAGGDRDSGKRPIMGKEAAQRADLVIITDDNPRSEDPAAIRAAVLAGTTDSAVQEANPGVEVREIGDRRQAIEAAVAWAQPGDVIVVAGKGHEVGQLIAGVQHHFDDREELQAAITARMGKEVAHND
ncbi:MAG: UDP-N-acetylmuramoyl-L-alanyl-D-glutamate--2,6-diaminopimelate ligase [Corynebacterium sp.]|uniref:UDP-N-acetylmuramoyl-L-alanyl-D-glutamate--2, 6-diaminopimelate ligase n=1 Tax=Corynebacterium sp. TaxID=1720 RepID=UPI0026DC6654|nr:UDP-N-acetylmuramoyl-L-alanyl-D-glutamate--2,6-diaminopimelate ligase [Corynebacterium sp.]MDO5097919.1 UDP-N-acetylmuramoyl-L-alanyl-D-glutamate--2,6-diaminopimelate ligase [Corynebacterium sp.]